MSDEYFTITQYGPNMRKEPILRNVNFTNQVKTSFMQSVTVLKTILSYICTG